MCMIDLYRNDEVLVDLTYDRFSMNPDMQDSENNRTGFRVMSDQIATLYPEYYYDPRGVIHPTE